MGEKLITFGKIVQRYTYILFGGNLVTLEKSYFYTTTKIYHIEIVESDSVICKESQNCKVTRLPAFEIYTHICAAIKIIAKKLLTFWSALQ
jgi:hypothetical protein